VPADLAADHAPSIALPVRVPLRAQYPNLYRGIVESFDLVREIPEGMIFRAK
jgi:hypothetical protein